MQSLYRCLRVAFFLFSILSLSACGGGGGSSSTDQTESSDWDNMQWNQDNWQ